MPQAIPVYLAAVGQTGSPTDVGLLDLIFHAHPVVLATLLLLVVMSVTTGAIILHKARVIRQATVQSQAFLELFWRSKRLDQVYEQAEKYRLSPVAEVFKAGYVELSKLTSGEQRGQMDLGVDNLTRSLRKAASVERTGLESLTPFLATTGSTAPFIGLFGTVVGILLAFQKIGVTGQATIQTVGPDIAHALIATAAGLVAAIPAVMAYNYFNARIRILTSEMENFSSDFLNIVKRHFAASQVTHGNAGR